MVYRKRALAQDLFGVLLALILGGGFCGMLQAQQPPDEIHRKSGGNLTGVRVQSETYAEVKYKKGAYEGRISTDKVTEIVYGDAPEAYLNGLEFLGSGDWENAVKSFKLAMEKRSVRPWIKTYGLLGTARAYQRWGSKDPAKYKDAIAAYQELLKVDPNTRFLAETLFELGRCQAEAGDTAGAVATFDHLAKEAYAKKLGVAWEARARYQKALARLEGGEADEAERDFRSALTFATDQLKSAEDEAVKAELERIAGLARLKQGTVLIKRKKYAEAQTFFQQILQNKASTLSAKAGAINGLGEILYTRGKLKEAQVQFAQAKVRYTDIAEEAARATYFLGLICLDLKEREPNYQRRAKAYFQEVITWYPDTEWAKKARAKIQ